MSYLLEALRKSERERQEKTAVPDLQTPTVEWETGDEPRQRSPWLTVAVIAICLNTILLAVLVWRFGFADNDGGNVAHEPVAAVASNAAATGPVNATPPMPPVIVVQQPTASNEAIVVRDRPRQESSVITPNQSSRYDRNADSNRFAASSSANAGSWQNNPSYGQGEAPVQSQQRQTQQRQADYDQRDAQDNRQADPNASNADAGDNNDADSRNRTESDRNGDANDATPSIHSLPFNIRQQLPMLTMNSHIYASNARDSFVMINGSAFGPGQDITAGLKLIAVVPEGAVLEFKGHRFLLPALASFSP